MCGHRKKTAICKPKREASGETKPVDTLILHFCSLQNREKINFWVFFGGGFVFVFVFNLYLFLAVLGLRFCARAFSSCGSCGERGPLFIAVRGPLPVAASPVAEHRLQTRRLSSCGSRA